MNELEFLEGLKTDEEQFNELTAGAEHFIRLKKQSEQPSPAQEKTASALGGVLGSTLAGAGIGAGVGALSAEKGERLRGAAEGAIGYGAPIGFMGGLLGLTPDKITQMASRAKELKKTQHARSAITALKTPSRNVDMGFDKMWAEGGENKGQLAKALLEAVKGPKIKAASDPLSEKRASLAEKLKQIGPLAGGLMAGGAAVGGLGTYLASKPQDELGGKSRAEDELEASVEAQRGRPERGLLHKMKNRTTELEHGYAQAFRDHPAKASLLGAAAGASGGYGLAKLLDALRHGAK